MLDCPAMRVGFVTRLLWDRYGPFWTDLVAAAPAEVILPDPERVARASQDPRLGAVSGRAFREAAAQAIALAAADCDRIVAPELNPGYEGSRGSAQDPFVARFPEALAQAVPGLPPVLAVPADLGVAGLETVAVETLLAVSPGPAGVRRAWQTRRANARPPRPPRARVAERPSEVDTVALVGQPWHLDERAAAALEGPTEHVLSAHTFAPDDLRAEGARVDAGLAPTDAEALGAVRRLARRAGIARLRMIVDPESGADAWLERRARALVRGPFETVPPPDPDAPSARARAAARMAGDVADEVGVRALDRDDRDAGADPEDDPSDGTA